jgi:hypothetical protein
MFDIVGQARFNHITTCHLHQLRDELDNQAARNQFAHKWGLSLEKPLPLDRLAIDRHLQTPHDPAHALLQNVTRSLLSATLTLFNSVGEQVFSLALRSYDLPPGWPRFQDPINHLSSFFFSDYGRLMAIGPPLLTELKEEHFKKQALEGLRVRLGLHRNSQVITEILECWITMARANALCFAEEVDDFSMIDKSLAELTNRLIHVSWYFMVSR